MWLVWTIWTSMSAVLKKNVKLNHSLTHFYYRPPGKFRFTHLGEIVKMLYVYIYDACDNRYGFSISV